jgi:sulfoxide reductase heme-binding subunit YedZ
MSVAYQAVGWNAQKKIYDQAMLAGIALYLGLFLGFGLLWQPEITAETLLLRAFGSLALLLLHVVLSIGPLARLDRRFLPLLYNRRHLGVTLFFFAALHGGLALVQFHALGVVSPLVNLLGGAAWLGGVVPFQIFGVAALAILFLMAATSHDFWLTQLGAPWWKALHMLVYLAYALIVLHVVFGILQTEKASVLGVLVIAGLAWLAVLHGLAARREHRLDDLALPSAPDRWVDVCAIDEIAEKRARIFPMGGERVAVFRYDGQVSAISNVCRHQAGPLGEGKIVDGCVVCPWHGYQYRPGDGASPPPFQEKVATFAVAVRSGRVWVDPRPLPPGTPVTPARIEPDAAAPADDDPFYIGYLPRAPAGVARWLRPRLAALGFLAAGVAATLVLAQAPFEVATFEYGAPRTFEGTLTLAPHPILWLDPPGKGAARPLLLTGAGKHGAEADLAALDGRRLRLDGTLIYREDLTMAEVVPGSARTLAPAGEGPASRAALGRQTLHGEIVDGKCHLGVMKPGSGRVHRECAMLCIRGGVQPLFVVRRDGQPVAQLLLVGADGRAIGREILELVARPLEATGEVERWGDLLVLRAEPKDLRLL